MKRKSEIITFKVDDALLDELKKIPNRSAFIRNAILAALESTCPLCQGTGILTPSQQDHWTRFARDHQMAQCTDCHELYIVCEHTPPAPKAKNAKSTKTTQTAKTGKGN